MCLKNGVKKKMTYLKAIILKKFWSCTKERKREQERKELGAILIEDESGFLQDKATKACYSGERCGWERHQ